MALKKQWMGKGVTATNAYYKVLSLSYGDGVDITAFVGVFYDQASSSNSDDYIYGKTYTSIPYNKKGNQNIHTQIYDYLKTLPEFSGSIDV